MKPIICPKCKAEFRGPKRGPKDLQHHLFMSHNVNAMDGHKMAAEALEKVKPGTRNAAPQSR